MATSPLTLVLITAISSIVGALLAILLTPRLQHHFWKYQKLDELRLAAISEFNRLASKFITGHMAEIAYAPDLEWYEAFSALSGTIRTLFSPAGFKAFKAVEVLIGPSRTAAWERRVRRASTTSSRPETPRSEPSTLR